MTTDKLTDEQLSTVMDLLAEAAEHMEDSAPNPLWFRKYFLITGQHMILTDEGWESGESKSAYLSDPRAGEDAIMDEVNAPELPK